MICNIVGINSIKVELRKDFYWALIMSNRDWPMNPIPFSHPVKKSHFFSSLFRLAESFHDITCRTRSCLWSIACEEGLVSPH